MKEEFLYYIWQHHTPLNKSIKCTNREIVSIISKGTRNTDAGPDFFNAKIKIDDKIWVGNVEVHLKASDWNNHCHQKNDAYNNVILHVVRTDDKPVFTTSGRKITCLKLENIENFYAKYKSSFQKKLFIPCEASVKSIHFNHLNIWMEKIIIERWEGFYNQFKKRLISNFNDWEETFYQLIAQTFGLKANKDTFDQLARILPLKILLKHRDSLLQIEALLFGQAGFLNQTNIEDIYFKDLKREYSFLKKKYNLKNLDVSQWKFLRLRPANFPTIRLAQLAMLMHHTSNLFSQIIEVTSLESLHKLLFTKASKYWDNHYNFGKETSKTNVKKIGNSMHNLLLINCVLPLMFTYGKHYEIDTLKDRSLTFLAHLPAEKNHIIRAWNNLGIKSTSAFFSQALLQLKKEYCNFNRCLNCDVGHQIIKNLNENI